MAVQFKANLEYAHVYVQPVSTDLIAKMLFWPPAQLGQTVWYAKMEEPVTGTNWQINANALALASLLVLIVKSRRVATLEAMVCPARTEQHHKVLLQLT